MAYRAGEVEVLLTVDDSDVSRAEKNVKTTGERIEKKPLKKVIEADDDDALKGMDRVEQAAKKLVSERAVVQLDADIARTEKQFERAQNRLEDLQVKAEGGLNVDADVRRAENNLRRLEANLEGLRKARSVVDVEADTTEAVRALQRVETQKQVVSREVALRVNANVANAESAVKDLRDDLDYLRSLSTTVDVDADVRQAEAKLAGAEAALRDLQGARAEMVVDVNEGGVKQKLQDVADFAEETGGEGGLRSGAAMVTGIVAGLASIPIVGAIAKIAHTAADTLIKEFEGALQIEVRQDRLQALTGIDEASAGRFARLAAEAYVNNFGDSIESNMNTTRLALQFDLIDGDSYNREADSVIRGLSGIADVLDEDVKPTATAVSTLLRSGLSKSASQAFDLIAAGAREGLNRNEDLLDTLTEYPVVLSRLGLSGEEALGLINQGLKEGARNTDVVADALKEFQIRATDGSTASAAGFERLGLSAEEMTAKIAAGGEGAREGLQIVLDKLRETEDPVVRNAAAVELFGTKAEDLGAALFALDVTTAVDSLNGVTGAAERMFETIADNDASRVQQAQRNIEVAAEGIKGALAGAFSEPLGDFADFVSQNRGPVLQFLSDLVNGALDFGVAVVEGTATGTEAIGDFISGPLADLIDQIGEAGYAIDQITPGDQSGLWKWAGESAQGMREFGDITEIAARTMREDLVGGIEETREKFNGFIDPQIKMGLLNDASLRVASAIDQVGLSADGATPLVDAYTVAQDGSVTASSTLESQIRSSIAALSDEISAAQAAGESQGALKDRYDTATGALVNQLTQMGLTQEQARSLIDTVLETPASATTEFSSNATTEQGKVQALADRVTTLPDGTIVISADDGPARNVIEQLITFANGKSVTVPVRGSANWVGGGVRNGGVIEFMAQGGIPDLVPMDRIAQMVSPNTWRVVGDRSDVDEAYVPLDGSPRSWSILMEALRRMPGGSPAGAVTAPGGDSSSTPPIQVVSTGNTYYSYDPTEIAREQREHLGRAVRSLSPR